MLFLTRSATILLGRCSFENFNFSDTYVFAYIYFPSLENILFYRDLGVIRILYLMKLMLAIYKHVASTIPGREKCLHWELFWSTFSHNRTRITPNTDTFYAVYPFVKTADFDVPENHFLQMVAKKFFFTWLAMKLTSCFS